MVDTKVKPVGKVSNHLKLIIIVAKPRLVMWLRVREISQCVYFTDPRQGEAGNAAGGRAGGGAEVHR